MHMGGLRSMRAQELQCGGGARVRVQPNSCVGLRSMRAQELQCVGGACMREYMRARLGARRMEQASS